MSRDFRAMLAATAPDLTSLTYPLYVSPKLDGIRAVVKDGRLVSRNGKLIPNQYIQSLVGRSEYEGLDGELIVGHHTAEDVFNVSSSAVMSRAGTPDFKFHVFDDCSYPDIAYADRYSRVARRVAAHSSLLPLVYQSLAHSSQAAALAEGDFLNLGYEGMMLRSLDSPYKYGRGTLKKQDLLKFKRFEDAEAVIIGFEELLENTNEATTNEVGASVRSNHKAGMVPGGTLGALVVRGYNGTFKDVVFNIGSGFTAELRMQIWNQRSTLLGALVTYKFFPIGCINAPRFPIFKGIRDRADLSR